MVETEFCTVQPSIFKKCQNDWISKNGTCYEDSCCMSIETAKSWYYRCAQLSHIFVSILGLFLTFVYFKNYSQKHILPFNVRVFVNIQLFLIIFHSVDMSIIHIYHLFQSFVAIMSNPCFVRVRVDSCALFRYIYSFCTVCLTICQYSLYADRLFCIFWKNYSKFSNYLLVVLLFQMYLISTSLVYFVYKDEDSESYLLSCLNTPVKSLDNLVIVTASLFPINIVCLLLSIILFHAFRNKKERSRFDMTRYFTAKVDAESSEFLFNTTVTQAFHIVIYPIFSILMRLYYDETPRPLHLTFATLSYVISLYCLAVPAVMVSTVKRNRIMKKENIWNHVKLKSIGVEGADNYFNSLQSQWR